MSSIPMQYRALLKAGYAAVNHAAYQKRHVRARIRRRFIDPPDNNVKANLDLKINNTLEFLNIAAKRRGLESAVVRNICDLEYYMAEYSIRPPMHTKKLSRERKQIIDNCYDEYNLLIDMLNKQLDLLL